MLKIVISVLTPNSFSNFLRVFLVEVVDPVVDLERTGLGLEVGRDRRVVVVERQRDQVVPPGELEGAAVVPSPASPPTEQAARKALLPESAIAAPADRCRNSRRSRRPLSRGAA